MVLPLDYKNVHHFTIQNQILQSSSIPSRTTIPLTRSLPGHVNQVPPRFRDHGNSRKFSQTPEYSEGLAVFQNYSQIVGRFGHRHDAHSARALFDSRASNVSTARASRLLNKFQLQNQPVSNSANCDSADCSTFPQKQHKKTPSHHNLKK